MKPAFSSRNAMLMTILTIAVGMALVSSCAMRQPAAVSGPISYALNGSEPIALPGAVMRDDHLFVPASFLESVFGADIVWASPSSSSASASASASASSPAANTPDDVAYDNAVAVLMYHHVDKQPTSDAVIATARFEEHMQALRQGGYHPIDMAQYAKFMLEGGDVPDNAVLITFDDGYESFYTEAYPILRRYDYPAVNFVIVSAIDDRAKGGVPKLTWEQMREMQRDGNIGFYSHTFDLHRYGPVDAAGNTKPETTGRLYREADRRSETDDEYRSRVANDLAAAEDRLRQELGNTFGALAFPYGAFDDELLRLTEDAGIPLTFSVDEGVNGREDKVGYRINGAAAGLTGAALTSKLRELGGQAAGGSSIAVSIDGKPAQFRSAQPVVDNGELLVPLRDYCRMNGIAIEWHKQRKVVELRTAGAGA